MAGNVRDADAQNLFAWIIEHYKKTNDVLSVGDNGGVVMYAAIRIPSGNVGMLMLARMSSPNDPEHYEVTWADEVEWPPDYRYVDTPHDQPLFALSTLPTYEDALNIMEYGHPNGPQQ